MKDPMMQNKLIAKTFFGMEEVCARELKTLGAKNIEILNRAVAYDYEPGIMYKTNLWSRTALLILKDIANFKITKQDDLYDQLKLIEWDNHFEVHKTISLKSNINKSIFNHSHYVSLKAKDAIADYFRDKCGERPSVDTENPQVKINVHIFEDNCSVSLDSSGDPLFKRGYRRNLGEAPINECLAAGLLMMGNYSPDIPLIDPMCGSGTFAIEASLMATNTAPGSFRKDFVFQNWKDFDKTLWDNLVNEAKDSVKDVKFDITAFDISSTSISDARQNILRADMLGRIKLFRQDFFKYSPPPGPGMLIVNPPYGQRLKERNLPEFYGNIGKMLKFNYMGYNAWIISSEKEAMKKIALKPFSKNRLYNGPLEVLFYGYSLYEGSKKIKE